MLVVFQQLKNYCSFFFLLVAIVCIDDTAAQEDESHLVAQISTVPYDDNLHKGGLSFETKDGSASLQRRLLIASNGYVGINVPEENDPRAMIDVRGDILARNATLAELIIMHSMAVFQSRLCADSHMNCSCLLSTSGFNAFVWFHSVANIFGNMTGCTPRQVHQNLTAHHVISSKLDVSEQLTVSCAKVLKDFDAPSISTESLKAKIADVAEQLNVGSINSGSLQVRNTLNTSVIGADNIETRRISTTGIRMDQEWPMLENDQMCSGSTVSVTLEANLQTLDGCKAECLGDERCVATIWDSSTSSCNKKQDACTTTPTTPTSHSTYMKPALSYLDMSAELAAAKTQILRQNAKIAQLETRFAVLEERLNTLLGPQNPNLPRELHPIAFSGQYSVLVGSPTLDQLAGDGKLDYTNLKNAPTLDQLAWRGKLDYSNVVGAPASSSITRIRGPYEARGSNYEAGRLLTTDFHGIQFPNFANHACYLTEVHHLHDDTSQQCVVTTDRDISPRRWVVVAADGRNQSPEVWCKMHCIEWSSSPGTE